MVKTALTSLAVDQVKAEVSDYLSLMLKHWIRKDLTPALAGNHFVFTVTISHNVREGDAPDSDKFEIKFGDTCGADLHEEHASTKFWREDVETHVQVTSWGSTESGNIFIAEMIAAIVKARLNPLPPHVPDLSYLDS